MCRDCRRQSAGHPENRAISDETWKLADRLLSEKIPIAGISRVTGISEPRLQKYINEKYENIPEKIEIIKKSRLTIQCDEMRSFAGNKKNKQWIWPALDHDSEEIAGVYAGSRDRKGAQGLWDSLPAVYRQCAVCYTDFRCPHTEKFFRQRGIRQPEKKAVKPVI